MRMPGLMEYPNVQRSYIGAVINKLHYKVSMHVDRPLHAIMTALLISL